MNQSSLLVAKILNVFNKVSDIESFLKDITVEDEVLKGFIEAIRKASQKDFNVIQVEELFRYFKTRQIEMNQAIADLVTAKPDQAETWSDVISLAYLIETIFTHQFTFATPEQLKQEFDETMGTVKEEVGTEDDK